jgi:tetratricopeptide (TPR) repeat protein
MILREQTGQGMARRTLTVSLLTVGIACAFPPCVGWTSGSRNDFTRRLSAGQRLYEQGNMDAAIAEFKAAVAAQPDSAIAHLWLGRALGRKIEKAGPLQALRMVGDVRREFEQAVALDANNVEARSDLLQYYLGAPPSFGGGIDKAEAQADAIAKLDPAMGQRARALIAETTQEASGSARADDD